MKHGMKNIKTLAKYRSVIFTLKRRYTLENVAVRIVF